MSNLQLHKVHVAILHALRRAETVRFSTLMKPTELKSDAFKFYLRKLTDTGLVERTSSGSYRLTAPGKEFANNLDENKRTAQRQPKLSILIVAARSMGGERQILFQRRLRNPFYGFWSLIGGPVQWGEDFEDAAMHEFTKQTGMTATFRVRSFYRKRDYKIGTKKLLEDKLFVILEATNISGTLQNSWSGGYNQWMTPHQLRQQAKHFESTVEITSDYPDFEAYTSRKVHYELQDY
jgi:predicted transcriptional regulator